MKYNMEERDKVKRRKKVFLIFLLVGIVYSIIGRIGNILLTPKGEKRKEIEENLKNSILEQRLKKNYSMHISIYDKYDIDIVNEDGKLLVYYAGWLDNETGALENNVLKRYKEAEFVSEESCTYEELQKKLGVDVDQVCDDWKEQLQKNDFDKVKCNRIVSLGKGNGYTYTWKFQKDIEKEHFKLYVDSNKDGTKYEYLGIDYYQKYKTGKINYQMCFSDDSPIGYELISNEHFYTGNDCLSYEELKEEIDSMGGGNLEDEDDL